MFDMKKVEIEWGGKTLTLETGRVARQADGAVLATLGETVVLCAVTAAKNVKPGQDFFPLTVHYQEKYSAAGTHPRAASSSASAAPPSARRSPAASSTGRSGRSSRRAFYNEFS
jgi:ribonuclease PH